MPDGGLRVTPAHGNASNRHGGQPREGARTRRRRFSPRASKQLQLWSRAGPASTQFASATVGGGMPCAPPREMLMASSTLSHRRRTWSATHRRRRASASGRRRGEGGSTASARAAGPCAQCPGPPRTSHSSPKGRPCAPAKRRAARSMTASPRKAAGGSAPESPARPLRAKARAASRRGG